MDRVRHDAGDDIGQFLDQLYRDVLGREPDGEGKEYWLDLLDRGVVTRGTIVVYFTESEEMKGIAVHRNEIVAASLVRDGISPSEETVDEWLTLRSTRSTADALSIWYSS